VFAVATVLPLNLDRSPCFAFEVDFAEHVAAILTLDGILPRGEESSFVFWTKYSHIRSSLYRRVTVQAVLGAKHCTGKWGRYGLPDENIGREVCGRKIDYGDRANIATLWVAKARTQKHG
jgi:hypothetical protein